MKRKLIKQGIGGFTIYLPKKWIDERGLKGKEEIEIEEVENSLVLTANSAPKKREIEIHALSDNQQFLRMTIWNPYRRGFDRMIINYKTKKQKQIIEREIEKHLLGFEIVDTAKHLIIAENVTEPSDEKQEVLLRRMFLLVKEGLDAIEQDIKKGKTANYDIIEQTMHKMIQYDNFCKRNITKKRFKEEKSHFYWTLYTELLLIHLSFNYLYESIGKNKPLEASEKTKAILDIIKADFNKVYKSFFSKDVELVKQFNTSARNVLKFEIYKLIQETKGSETLLLYHLGEVSRLIYLCSSPIVGILLN